VRFRLGKCKAKRAKDIREVAAAAPGKAKSPERVKEKRSRV
jgi:hypothetical protein